MNINQDSNLSSKVVLVTGGCGFIGSNLVHQLVAMGWDVDVVDDVAANVDAHVVDVAVGLDVDSDVNTLDFLIKA